MLSIEGLMVSYGEMPVLRGVTLLIEKGMIVSVLGSNGAGKSTLLRAISGLIGYSGSITFEGTPLISLPAHAIVQLGIVQVPEGRKIFPEMSVTENLMMGAYLHKSSYRQNLEKVFELFPRLAERRKQAGGTMSGGEQQMLAIGRGMMGNPRLLLLDEPSLGLSPMFTETVFRAIETIRKSGVTVLLIEQNVHQALAISDKGYVLGNGTIVLHGSREELLDNPEVRRAFLGM
jgi:branched-chain amino acid transport system ATP-binding protein